MTPSDLDRLVAEMRFCCAIEDELPRSQTRSSREFASCLSAECSTLA